MEQRSLIERLARHLAAGSPESWPDRAEDAASILAILKEPDAAMRAAGDEGQWRAMIDAALRERWTVAPASAGGTGNEGAADEEGEIRLPERSDTDDRAGWVHIHRQGET